MQTIFALLLAGDSCVSLDGVVSKNPWELLAPLFSHLYYLCEGRGASSFDVGLLKTISVI